MKYSDADHFDPATEGRHQGDHMNQDNPQSQRLHLPPEVTVHLHHHGDNENELSRGLAKILKSMEKRIMAALDELRAAVAKNTEVDQSAITLLKGIKAKLDAAIASGDPKQVQALADQLGASTQALADAVTENTPAEEDPPADPPADPDAAARGRRA